MIMSMIIDDLRRDRDGQSMIICDGWMMISVTDAHTDGRIAIVNYGDDGMNR